MKKYLLSLITLTFFLCEASFIGGGMVFAATSGSCGTNLTWSYNSSNTTLTISQSNTTTNSMTNWTSSNYNNSTSGRPWQEHASSITTIVINGGVKTIGNYAFKGMSSVTSIKFGTGTASSYKSSVTTIGNNAFDGCSSLATIYYYGGISGWLGITFSNAQATPFYSKSGGGTLYIDGTTSTYKYTALTTSSNIKDYAFYKNKDLANITLNAGVTTIGASAFANCTGIATVKFGSASSTDECGIISISNNAFQGCSNVTSVYCYGGIAKWLNISFGNIASNPFCATSSNKTQYFYLNGTSTSTVTIPSNVTEIKANAFYNNRAITTLKLGTNSTTEACGVNNIRSWAFMNCTNLTTINCYGGINKWLNIAFEDVQSTPFYSSTGVKTFKLNNSAVTALIIPDDATEVKAYAFYNNTALTSVTLGTGLKNIRTNAFYGCSNLTTINFNATNCSDLSSSTQAFNNAGTAGSGITLNIGSGVNVIPGYLFYPSVSNGTASSQAKLTSVVFADESSCSTIKNYAFAYTNQLTSIRLPSIITAINSSAFTSSALTSTYFDGTVKQWCNITFGNMSANPVYISQNLYINNELVENLVIPSDVDIIKAYAFYNDTSITSVHIPTSITNIASDAFNNCKNIVKTQYAGSPKQWSSITFGNKNSNPMYKSHNIYLGSPDTLTTYIYMPDDLDAIKDYAFAGNTTINEISIDPSTTPANSAFDECSANIVVRGALNGYCGDKTGGDGTNLTWILDEGVLTISGLGAMESYSSSSKQPWYGYRNSITSIVVEDGVTTLGNNFAYGSVNATSVSLPGTLTTVGNYVFQSCTSLKAVSFPASVTSLGTNVLYGCSSLEYIIVARTESVTTLTTTSPYTSRKIYVPYSVLDTYKAATKWSDLASNIYPYTGSCGTSATWTYSPADSTLTISGTGAMTDFASSTAAPWNGLKTVIASLSVANGVTTIGKYAFYGCTAITSLNDLPSSITTMGYQAFYGCTALASVTIPQNVIKAGDGLFNGCSSLTTVVWNAENCTKSLNSSSGDVALSASWNPFYGSPNPRTKITSFTFGSNVEVIPNGLCSSMSNLTSVTIPSSVESIGDEAFKSTGLTSISIPNNVTSIGTGAFQSCTALASVTLPSGITSIGSNTFNGCTALTSLDIPAAVESIGNYAFKNCTGLTEMHSYNTTAPSTTSYTFDGLSSTAIKIYVPSMAAKTSYEADDYWDADQRTIIALSGTCGASSNEENVTYIYTLADSTLTISGTGEMANYSTNGSTAPWYALKNIITKIVVEEGVSKIGSYAFYGYTTAREVYVPSTITAWGTSTFYNCSNSSKFYFGGTLAQWCGYSFGARASCPIYNIRNFYINNEKITELIIPDGVKNIGSYAFSGGNYFTSISLPASLETVSSEAFDMCNQVPTIIFRGTQEQWCAISFASFNANPVSLSTGKSLTIADTIVTYIYLPDTFPAIGNRAFYKNTTLVKISLSSNTTIGTDAFRDCTAELELRGNASGVSADGLSWSLVDSVLTISGTGAMTAYTSANAVPWYPYRSSIREVIIEDGVTTVGKYAFNDARKVKKVTLPPSISSIGDYSFQNCISIDSIICESSSVPTVYDQYLYYQGGSYISYAFENVPTTAVVNVPIALLTSFKTAGTQNNTSSTYGWRRFTNYHGYGECGASGDNLKFLYADATGILTIFGAGAMRDFESASAVPWYSFRSNIKSVVIESGVITIGNYAFYGCNNELFTSITIPEGVTAIGNSAFNGCTHLASVTLPSTLGSIGSSAFHSNAFTSISIPSSVSTISSYAFKNCANLTSIIVPNITTLNEETFYGCSNLASVTLPNSLTSIKKNTFVNCSSLTSITIPEYVTEIVCVQGSGSATCPFSGCTSLTSVVWNARNCGGFSRVGEHQEYAMPFESIKENIESFTFGANVTSIPSYVCHGMTGLTDITIPASVTTIGANAFEGCTNIATVTTNAATPPTIQSTTFPSSVESAATLYVPATVAARTAYSEDTYWGEFAHILPYVLTFDLQDHGDAIDPICVNAGRVDEALQPADPTEDYYTFDGWFSNEACTTPFTFGESGTVVNGDLTLYAKWTIYNYQVTFDLQGHGSSIAAQTIDHNGLVSKPSDPSAEHYIFGGWFKDDACSNAWNFSEDHVTSATTLYAKWTLEDLTLNDNANNASVLELYNTETTNVNLKRSLISASYNTICLPFAMTAAQVETYFGANCDIEELTRASYADGNLKLFFTKRTAIEAGKPYLIQPQSDVANPVISGVTIDNTSHPSVFDGVTFTGIFSPTVLANSDNLLFLGASNTLYMSSGGQMKGLRAYFELTTPQAQAAARRSARIILHEEGATGIEETITNDQSPITNKIIRDGQLFILRDGKTYNAQGALIK